MCSTAALYNVLKKKKRDDLNVHDESLLLQHAEAQCKSGFTLISDKWEFKNDTKYLDLGSFQYSNKIWTVRSSAPAKTSRRIICDTQDMRYDLKELTITNGQESFTFIKKGSNQSNFGRVSYGNGKSSSPLVAWTADDAGTTIVSDEKSDDADTSKPPSIIILTSHTNWYRMENCKTWFAIRQKVAPTSNRVGRAAVKRKRSDSRPGPIDMRPPLPSDPKYLPKHPTLVLLVKSDDKAVQKEKSINYLKCNGIAMHMLSCSEESPVSRRTIDFDIGAAERLFNAELDGSSCIDPNYPNQTKKGKTGHRLTQELLMKGSSASIWAELILKVRNSFRMPYHCLVLKKVHLLRQSDGAPAFTDHNDNEAVDEVDNFDVDYVTVSCCLDAGSLSLQLTHDDSIHNYLEPCRETGKINLIAFPSLLYHRTFVPDGHKCGAEKRKLVFFFQVRHVDSVRAQCRGGASSS